MRLCAAMALGAALAVAAAATANAHWTHPGTGSASARAVTLPAGATPTAAVTGRTVTVTWAASTLADGNAVGGYAIRRYDAAGAVHPAGAGCAGTVAAVSCTEDGVPPGDWRYAVVPLQGEWSGSAGPRSAAVSVAVPSLTLTSSPTVATLPATLDASLAGFAAGQTVVFRLDDPEAGTVLTASLTPSLLPAGGAATAALTIPAGTPNGPHTVHAIGSSGDRASASFTVAAPAARSFTVPAWTVSDLSSGSASDASDPFSAAGGPYHRSPLGYGPAFDTSRYLALDYAGPLRPGMAVSSASFDFTFSATDPSQGTGASACFYFELRRRSTGAVLGTHGSPASPVACWSSFSWSPRSTTALPEVTSTDVANDLQVRVFLTNAASGYDFADLATVSVTAQGDTYTLQEESHVSAASGAPSTVLWSLTATGDGRHLTSGSGWENGFSTSRYLRFAFPAYVPTGATGVSATFRHTYASDVSGTTTCWYFEVYSGTARLSTHGSPSSPVSCNASTTFVTDTVALPAVNTVARANGLSVRVYVRASGGNSGARRSRHDRAAVTVAYTG